MRLSALAAVLVLAACASDPEPLPMPPASGTDDVVAVAVPADTVDVPSEAGPTPADAPDAGSLASSALADWAGEPAVRLDGRRFVSEPAVRAKLAEAFGVEPGLLDRLEGDADYRAGEVTAAGQMLAVAYQPTDANPDPRPLYLLVNTDTGAVHAVLTDGGDTFHRASYDATAADLSPEGVAWMQRQSGVDVAELARLDDETVLGP